ncbi:hypothetical protein KP509_16G041100 [Ceratopteris richardii]|uniref:Pollen Ole e 1 allergen and extensin family protein n=1 Tax=Ceratopteris richardii TaxID=49495 RepID=A0A8T2SY96_CERRI|nr:hypothetical protein KP509_16G041100 [Ceratopteris richardii]
MDSLQLTKQSFSLCLIAAVAMFSVISAHRDHGNQFVNDIENEEVSVEHAKGWHNCNGACGRSGYGLSVYEENHDDDADKRQNGYSKAGGEDDQDDTKDDGEQRPNYDQSSRRHGNQARLLATVVPVSISVQGTVSCQACKYVGTDSLTDAKPLAGATVILVCEARRRRRGHFIAAAKTNEDGSFLISVPNFDFERFAPVDDCKVYLASSFRGFCSRSTNINNGKFGSKLRPIPTFAPSENLMYSVGPFAFSPRRCVPKRFI